MNQILSQIGSNLGHALGNAHFSVPSIVGAGFAVAAVIWPTEATKLNTIAGILVGYGFIAADNTPSAPKPPTTPTTPAPTK